MNNFYFNSDEVKTILKLITRIDDQGFDYSQYNYNKMVVYDCKGYDLTGSTSEATFKNGRHFLVNNNHYTVYEVPHKKNKGLRMTGEFAVVIKNNDFDFFIFAQMTHKFEITDGLFVKEKVNYYNTGEFYFLEDALSSGIRVGDAVGAKCCRGWPTTVFDDDDVRKEDGYHTTRRVINKHFGIKQK